MANELVVIEPATALDLFTAPDKVQVLLSGIREKALAEQAQLDTDLSKAKNRDAIKSLAYKVTQSKTYIDKAGKAVVDELKELPKKVDASRKQCRDELDALSEEIRQPVTAWEDAEKARVAAEELVKQIERDHEEALQMNELHDLRKAEEERKRIEHENEIKRQAAEQARIEAEQKAQRDREAAELKAKQEREAAELKARQEVEAAAKRERQAREAQERAEREKQEAIAKAEREKLAAVEAERRKAEEAERARLAEVERQKQEELKRLADTAHRAKVNNQAMQDLIATGIPEDCAKACIIAIAKGAVSSVKINY
ncbi:cell envelope biogenesis protein TolA [Morganella morganii]|uniref:cell envelope biogenesis protein TolA n=1 Tax=Morganella morganii TaxID=582 RepID=UPI001BDA78BA|nr:cell envelope biogenesis protein TolA [Morganella morganii]MBT0504602.1 cell envelope biogenesis protein TolA [Morganella morganii subsp. morganii]MDW7787262.1 cell envelope biogenesis protein TolA [Morganella morganii]QWM12302.1 cell envelope biogenesis protein TolA [Morganella morganii subsp. morganii]